MRRTQGILYSETQISQ